MGKALSVEGHPIALTHHVRLLLDDVEQALPGQVGGDALGLVEHDAQLVQRLGDLDAIAHDVLVEPVLVDGVGQVHGCLCVPTTAEFAAVAAGDQEIGVLHTEVGVVADAGDDEDVAAAVVRVEIRAVVEVPVRLDPARRSAGEPGGSGIRPWGRAFRRFLPAACPTMTGGRTATRYRRAVSISPKCTRRAPVRMNTQHHTTPE